MFKCLVFFCVIAAAFAEPGVLAPSLSIAARPALVAAPAVGIVRTAPIALGASIGSPLAISGGLVSGGLVSKGLVTGGLVSGGLINGGLVNGGLVSGKALIR